MRIFKPKYRDKTGELKPSPNYWVEVKHRGRRCRLPAFTSRNQSEKFGEKLHDLMIATISGESPDASLVKWAQAQPPTTQKRLVRAGLLSGRFAGAGKPLVTHLTEWKAALLAKGNTSDHAQRYFADAGRVVALCKAVYLADLSASRVHGAIETLRDGDAKTRGLSLQSCNHVLRAIKAFSRWLVTDRRTSEDPLAGLSLGKGFNPEADPRHQRRALSDDEIRWLLKTTSASTAVLPFKSHGLAGVDRAMLYQLALGTGFRRDELASLTRASIDLEASPPTVTIAAAYSKRRRQDVQPIREDLATALEDWLKGKSTEGPLWAMPSKTADMLRADLAAARAAWLAEAKGNPKQLEEREKSDFLRAVDAGGRVIDFHALRHTFITRLVQSGATVKVAQELARHSTPVLTLHRFSDVGLHDSS
ncbi:MAG: tyrosine-type recombinase/integrase [Phycisphaerae bacterium]